jgi:hypothetical protein
MFLDGKDFMTARRGQGYGWYPITIAPPESAILVPDASNA